MNDHIKSNLNRNFPSAVWNVEVYTELNYLFESKKYGLNTWKKEEYADGLHTWNTTFHKFGHCCMVSATLAEFQR